MNWIVEAYSNVYTTAMMQPQSAKHDIATAKERTHAKRSSLFRLLGRR
jgi:hypothetical protein